MTQTAVADADPRNDSKDTAMRTVFGPMLREYFDGELPAFREAGRNAVIEAAKAAMAGLPAQKVEINLNGEPGITLPRQHFQFPGVLRLLHARDRSGAPLNVALVGPTGTGKTRMAINAAEALDQEFILQPFNPTTTKSDLLGFVDAGGRYVESAFYRAFKKGLLFIADEFDAANPAIATVLNAAVSNRALTFPNGETVKAHADFRGVFIMNTYGLGADDRYTGRSRLDAATLDRFVYVHIPIDGGLEASLIGIPDIMSPPLELLDGGRFADEREILQRVVTIRGIVERERMRHSVSPRSTIHAYAMHEAGFGKKWIEDCCIWRGMSKEDREKIQRLLQGAR